MCWGGMCALRQIDVPGYTPEWMTKAENLPHKNYLSHISRTSAPTTQTRPLKETSVSRFDTDRVKIEKLSMPPSDGIPPSEAQVLCRCFQCYAQTSVDQSSATLVNGKYVDGNTLETHRKLQESLEVTPKIAPDQVVSSVYLPSDDAV